MYSQTQPRNDASPSRGQWGLDGAYRYLAEAYGGYHINAMHGINVDAGIFMSYIGLFSWYNFDNWAYQPSYVSSNTPFFFNGLRVQLYPTEKLKIEPWIINGWQSYGRFNNRMGFGFQVLYRPSGAVSIVSNGYMLGEDTLGVPGRIRYHSDNSLEVKYYDHPERTLDKLAFSVTGDIGCEHGGGVSCTGNSAKGPKQSFLGFMFYNRAWFNKNKYGLTLGGGRINNRTLAGADSTDQWRDGGIRNAVLHGESRRPIQGVGCVRDLRLYAQPIHYIPVGIRPPSGERAVLLRAGRSHANIVPERAAGREYLRYAGIVGAGLYARFEGDREPNRSGDSGKILSSNCGRRA
jgi:hypothetical protein